LKTFAIESEKSYHISADPIRIPGNIDLGNPLISFDSVHTRVSCHGLEQGSPILIGFRCIPSFSGDYHHQSPLGGKDNVARRILSQDSFSFARGLRFTFERNQSPSANGLRVIISETRLHRNDKQDQSS